MLLPIWCFDGTSKPMMYLQKVNEVEQRSKDNQLSYAKSEAPQSQDYLISNSRQSSVPCSQTHPSASYHAKSRFLASGFIIHFEEVYNDA